MESNLVSIGTVNIKWREFKGSAMVTVSCPLCKTWEPATLRFDLHEGGIFDLTSAATKTHIRCGNCGVVFTLNKTGTLALHPTVAEAVNLTAPAELEEVKTQHWDG